VVPSRLGAAQAQRVHLAAQGLLSPPRRRARRGDIAAVIARMQLLQIDTIHVVARSPYLVLYSRLGAYPPAWLDAALESGEVFECWAHEACCAPWVDLALHHHHMREMSKHWAMNRAQRLHAANRAALDALLAYVREHGPVKSSDFERPRSAPGGWWGWKEEKRLLEACFALGELMIARRENFQRVYDLSERVQHGRSSGPAGLADAAVRRAFILKAVTALGIAQARWIADYFRMRPRVSDAELEPLVGSGELVRVDVEGWGNPGYAHRDATGLLVQAAAGTLRATHTTLLSPFDPVVWDRERAATLFGFDYRLECYLPAPKRRYGYFVLPILRRGRLVGRLDAKAHRDEGRFQVKALYLEPGIRTSDALARDLTHALRACATWHGTPQVSIDRVEPATFARALRAALIRPASRCPTTPR
jgi:uncharacterized protein YcaQ